MHRVWAVVTASAICTSAHADTPLVKDLRAKGSTSSLAVVLCARPGIPGHAMVILGKDDEAKKACTVEAFGFYPVSATKAVLGPVEGTVADEFLQGRGIGAAACRVIVQVDQSLFDKVEAIRKRWAGKTYRVLEDDCVTFTDDVASALGLKRPDRSKAKLPVTYVQQLYEMNK